MQSGLHGGHLDTPLFPHDSIIVPRIHACNVLRPLTYKVKHVVDLPGVLSQGVVLSVYSLLAGHKHFDFSGVPVYSARNQLCVLLLNLYAMEIDI